ncbi:hypothetical protein P5673_000507 [Acropora cervicornis]|uniref:Secreted protein n=1 Tax=Acropora cervicornis TaxID=6130 RepID=A0AAD9VHV5_ACRCE|nr:hypothetical protein P5673_000507 [Acropora cervicornis]
MYTKIIPHITTAVWLAQSVVCWASVEEVAGSNQRRYGEKKMSVGSALDYKARDRWLNSYKGHFKLGNRKRKESSIRGRGKREASSKEKASILTGHALFLQSCEPRTSDRLPLVSAGKFLR